MKVLVQSSLAASREVAATRFVSCISYFLSTVRAVSYGPLPCGVPLFSHHPRRLRLSLSDRSSPRSPLSRSISAFPASRVILLPAQQRKTFRLSLSVEPIRLAVSRDRVSLHGRVFVWKGLRLCWFHVTTRPSVLRCMARTAHTSLALLSELLSFGGAIVADL